MRNSGKEPIKLYYYDKEGKFIQQFDSISVFKDQEMLGYKDTTKASIKRHGYIKTERGYAFPYKIGRNKLLRKIRIDNDILVKLSKLLPKDIELDAFNLNDEKIASFKNIRIAAEITNYSIDSIRSQIKQRYNKKSENLKSNIYFRIKE